jgi:hypothetical protein
MAGARRHPKRGGPWRGACAGPRRRGAMGTVWPLPSPAAASAACGGGIPGASARAAGGGTPPATRTGGARGSGAPSLGAPAQSRGARGQCRCRRIGSESAARGNGGDRQPRTGGAGRQSTHAPATPGRCARARPNEGGRARHPGRHRLPRPVPPARLVRVSGRLRRRGGVRGRQPGAVDPTTLRVVQSPRGVRIRGEFFSHIYAVSGIARTDPSLSYSEAVWDSAATEDLRRHVTRLMFRPALRDGRPERSTVMVSCQSH